MSAQNTTQNELVSIILPTYNRPAFLKEAIDSALNQTYKNIEVIVVDDSSTDDTEKICSMYGNKIRYFRRRYKGGIASAYNLGIEYMRGTWFKWLSDDNILAPDCVETLVNYANATKARIIYSDYEIMDVNGNIVGTRTFGDLTDYYKFATCLWNMIWITETSLIHRSCFDTVGKFDVSYLNLDYDWFLRACLVHACSFFGVPRPLIKARVHRQEASWIDFSDKEKVSRAMKVIDEIREKIKKQAIESNPERWRLFMTYKEQYEELMRGDPLVGIKKIVVGVCGPKLTRKLIDAKRSWYKKIKNMREVKCGVCQIYNVQYFLYLKPDTTHITCKSCSTSYSNENLTRLIVSQ